MTSSVTLVLPFPPSVNNLFPQSRRGRRFPSPQYRRWRDLAYWTILKAQLPKIPGPYLVRIVLDRPDARRRDASNYIKAPEDALVHMRVITDDSNIKEISAVWGDQKGKNITITIRTAH